ncbi:MAG: hypothetical protein GKB99_03185, partial [Methanocellales archaeon]|nr:hypothetical protein [Methanocellales archaeon]
MPIFDHGQAATQLTQDLSDIVFVFQKAWHFATSTGHLNRPSLLEIE